MRIVLSRHDQSNGATNGTPGASHREDPSWVRLIVETEDRVSCDMARLLEDRCPGFLKYAEDYHRAHPNARDFLFTTS